jgi:hypothetical protein
LAQRRTNSVLDVEAAFVRWYNHGARRSFRQVAHIFEVSDRTVRRAAWEHDWEGRADRLDRDARAMVDKQLSAFRSRAMSQLAEITTAELTRFARRPPNAVTDESGAVIRNPYILKPEEPSPADFLRTVKLLEAAGVIGAGVDRDDAAEMEEGLEEIRQQIAEMYAREEELRRMEAEEAMPPAS